MPEPIFRVRVAIPDDIPHLHQLIEQSVRRLQKDDYTPAQIEGALGHALGLDTQLVADGTYFVASPADEPDTFAACGGWSFRRTLFGSDHGPHRMGEPMNPASEPAKIRAIFVHPDWARRGLGSLLLAHCEGQARQAGFSTAEMGSTLTGVPLYLLKGYRRVAEIAVPLPNGEVLPVVHMTKNLL